MNGREFKELRERLGLSQRQAAELLGYSGKTAISNLEAKRTAPSLLPCVVLKLLIVLPEKRSKELQLSLGDLMKAERATRKRKLR